MGIFEGSPGNMVFTCRLDLLRNATYRRCGELVAWSVKQGGPGIPTLSALQYAMLQGPYLSEETNLEMAMEQITDPEAQDIMREVYGRSLLYS